MGNQEIEVLIPEPNWETHRKDLLLLNPIGKPTEIIVITESVWESGRKNCYH
jgi:hypothetical protein